MSLSSEALYRINISLPTGIVRVGSRGKYKFPLEAAKRIAKEYEADGYPIHFSPARPRFSYRASK
ncbi:hypothetical protein [Photobacterium lutimaris]|uniref:Uncharacterized protein n=1 Tax=Photobacterium lutimaris TaxID=388278 RepID=A0A2T3IXF4_9GAMM|nr:hypothetical protein [Photobacterium lutimaris]PSU33214.1 hypothetical protein C9I99_13530 [Photobacterium lutimaris]TDR75205.1 hypothetical protein DFP78_105225 [Photobacterium lutimaris]